MKYNPIEMQIDMPVDYIEEDSGDNCTLSGHFAGYDEEGYPYIWKGGSTSFFSEKTDIIKCKLVIPMSSRSQGIYRTNNIIEIYNNYTYNIVSSDVKKLCLVDDGLVRITNKDKQKSKDMLGYEASPLSINDPVVLIKEDNTYEYGHFAGYDENQQPYVFEKGGTSYTRGVVENLTQGTAASKLTDRDIHVKKNMKIKNFYKRSPTNIVVTPDKGSMVSYNQFDSNTTIHDANLEDTIFNNVNMSGVIFQNVNFRKAKFDNVNMEEVNFSNMNTDKMSITPGRINGSLRLWGIHPDDLNNILINGQSLKLLLQGVIEFRQASQE
jgi:hypothetical protein